MKNKENLLNLTVQCLEKCSSPVQQLDRGWHRVDRQGQLLSGERRWEMAELKDGQQWETEGELQCLACLTLIAQVLVPFGNQMHSHLFESL